MSVNRHFFSWGVLRAPQFLRKLFVATIFTCFPWHYFFFLVINIFLMLNSLDEYLFCRKQIFGFNYSFQVSNFACSYNPFLYLCLVSWYVSSSFWVRSCCLHNPTPLYCLIKPKKSFFRGIFLIKGVLYPLVSKDEPCYGQLLVIPLH